MNPTKSHEIHWNSLSPLLAARAPRPQSIIAPPSAIGKVVQAVTVTDGKMEVATISGLVIMGMFMVDVTN